MVDLGTGHLPLAHSESAAAGPALLVAGMGYLRAKSMICVAAREHHCKC